MELSFYKIFGKVVINDKCDKTDFVTMNKIAMKLGLFVPEELCYCWLFDFLKTQLINYNSTFYQKWEEITSKTREEQFLDQIRHYASTYGTDFCGETWLPERTELPDFPFQDLKVIIGITSTEAEKEIADLAYSNLAFDKDTLIFLMCQKHLFDISQIKNRQLKMMCIDETYKFTDGQECLNFILWEFFEIEMLVKNEDVLKKIRPIEDKRIYNRVLNNMVILSSVFYRNKDVFMHLKSSPCLKPLVNKIRKMAKTNHKPMIKSIWLRLGEMSSEERIALFKKTSIFKLTQMYNALSNPTGYYVIRNGKAFYKETKERNVNSEIMTELLCSIINKIPKVKSVALPKNIELTIPTSEKNFIGEIPLGSYVNCSDKNTMIGIYWRNEWGARDLDLHCLTFNGNALGWNGNYSDRDMVVFSGDMTNANPEATEIMWFKKEPIESIVSVNKYNGDCNYEYDLFIAQETTTDFNKGYMVNPKNITYRTHLKMEGKTNVTLGFFKDNKFFFHSCCVGNNIIPNKYRQNILEHLAQCKYLSVRQVLTAAGVEISDDAEVKLISKGDLIKFFS